MHNGGIAVDYFVDQQKLVLLKLRELNIKTFQEEDRIDLDITVLDNLIFGLREISEALLLLVYKK
ncbi:hypothetical protein [Clostridium cagae]|uniref:hypothetical protein n=1 Tax=Clostridium cagae TaxID=2080751 RepID=UPI000CF6893A|nr:hypothetical protein [Clostridium cagae]